jgi:hypothetical protein
VLKRPGVDVLDPELDGVKTLWLSKSESSFSSHTGLAAILTGMGTGIGLLPFLSSTVLSRLGNPVELNLLDDADADAGAYAYA